MKFYLNSDSLIWPWLIIDSIEPRTYPNIITENIYRAKQIKEPGLLEKWFGGDQSSEMTVYQVG
jgi:hypothetical protein